MSLRRPLMACACGGAAGAAGSRRPRSRPQDDDEDTFEQKIIKNILERPGRRRRPRRHRLSRALAAGGAADARSAAAASGRHRDKKPAWPHDPDVKRRQVRKQARTRARRPMSRAATSAADAERAEPRHQSARAARHRPGAGTGSIEEANIGRPMQSSRARHQGHLQLERPDGHPRTKQAKFDRRAAARQPDRAAARISDAVAGPALRRRQGRSGQRPERSTRTILRISAGRRDR